MRELPEPEGQLAWQTYTRDQVLVIQKQAYEDGLRDAWKESTDREFGTGFAEYLTVSQKEAKQKRHACDDPLCAVCGNPT